MNSGRICGVKGPNSCELCGELKLKPKCESMEPERARSRGSEKVADVGSECDRPGGEPTDVWIECVCVWGFAPCGCVDFSASFLRLMIILMSSFCFLRASLLLHHIGRLYSHARPRCLHAVHMGVPSSHFFLRNLHV